MHCALCIKKSPSNQCNPLWKNNCTLCIMHCALKKLCTVYCGLFRFFVYLCCIMDDFRLSPSAAPG